MIPEAAAPATGAPTALPAVGRAQRCELADGELWRLSADARDLRVANRLVELGAAGVGGFVQGGRDDAGIWLVRASAAPDLDAWLAANPGPIPWSRAAPMIVSLATAASACERLSLHPGALEHAHLVVAGDAITVRADALVHAMVGATAAEAAAPTWMPPEAIGRRPDNATNRYAIGLVAYRLVAGEHPFAGLGLRRGLDDQAVRGAPPFTAEIAATLPPGFQSLCLRILDPDPATRPPSADAILDALHSLGARRPGDSDVRASKVVTSRLPDASVSKDVTSRVPDATVRAKDVTSRVPDATVRVVESRTSEARVSRRAGVTAAAITPLVGGVVIAVLVIGMANAQEPRRLVTTPAKPERLAGARELADCQSCHPRHAAEWSRSVMAHAVESPLFQSLEMLIEEQVGRDRDCPNGAGVLRAAGANPCVNRQTGIAETGSGGALWCVNCHAPGENVAARMPAWNALSADAGSRRPLRDLLPPSTMEGISCVACHQMTGPARPGNASAGLYEGNPSWVSSDTGARFTQRPEDARGLFGIGNSGYSIDPNALLSVVEGDSVARAGEEDYELVPGGAHRRSSPAARAYQRSSEMCGACHDVRLFGTDAITGVERGEHFKRLRNAYSEWAAWADDEKRAGRAPASCQDCHMSLYPGVCEPAAGAAGKLGCPPGTAFAARAPGTYATGHSAAGSPASRITTHYFSGVDVPLARAFDPAAVDDGTLDVAGIPVGARQRRDLLLASAFRFAIDAPRRDGDRLEIPIVVENVGAGHRVPAGFSQEREIWVHLRVTDARGRLVYEVGRVERHDQDLADKVFLRVNTSDLQRDRQGRPLGMFGADIADGPDVPKWSAFGGTTEFRGRGLVNFQNGFLRCVSCIGTIDAQGRCQPGPGQELRRSDRYIDGAYDIDTGECRSNLSGEARFFEVFFPVGALDASRGIVKGPDAIVDTRSLAPRTPARYIYDLDALAAVGPFTVEATLEFRAFPPFLIRAFADYEAGQARLGLRPSGPLVLSDALDRLEIVHVATARAVIP